MLSAVTPPSSPPPAGRRARWRARWASLRLRGRLQVAEDVALGRGVRFELGREAHVTIERGATLADGCRLHVSSGVVRIGAGAHLASRCVLRVRSGATIEPGAVLGDEVAIVDHGPRQQDVERPLREQGLRAEPVVIGARARIGARAVIGPGARISPGAHVPGQRSVR